MPGKFPVIKSLFFTFLIVIGIALSSFIGGFPKEVGASTPLFRDILRPGESTGFRYEVTTGSTPVAKLDVAFVFDVTSSMAWVEDVCKDKAEEIKTSIKNLVDDTAFAVAWFADYPDYYSYPDYSGTYGATSDRPWNLEQDITTDLTRVSDAINSLPYLYGEDLPESYTRALYELEYLNWRQGSKKVVILFGDAPLHDLDFYAPTTYGGDPGRDGVAMTNDDLDFETVVEELKDEGIVIMGIYCKSETDPSYVETSIKSFNYMADRTGGSVIEIEEADEILPAISSLVESEVETINDLTLNVPPQYSEYVWWTPHNHQDVPPDTTVAFDVTITIPSDEGLELLDFSIEATGDGTLLGTVEISIEIPRTSQRTITCQASSYDVGDGESITITGSITPPEEGVPVYLEYLMPDGYVFTRYVTTGWDGSFIDEIFPDLAGAWEVTAYFYDEGANIITSYPATFWMAEPTIGETMEEIARILASTALIVLGGFGGTLLSNRIQQASGGDAEIEVGEVIEDKEEKRLVEIPAWRQWRVLLLGIILVGLMYALLTSAYVSELLVIEIPFQIPLIGDKIPLEYLSDIDIIFFMDITPVIIFSSGLTFIWRYILGNIASRMMGIKTALAGNRAGATTLIISTFLNLPLGFPLKTIHEGGATIKAKGYVALIKNLSPLILIIPFYLIWEYSLAGWDSLAVAYTGVLITLMTFTYTVIPYGGEGRDLYEWNRMLNIALVALGLILFIGFQLDAFLWEVYLSASLLSLIGVAALLYKLKEKNFQRNNRRTKPFPASID